MRGIKLTKTSLNELKKKREACTLFSMGKKQLEVWDSELPGFYALIGKKKISFMVRTCVPVTGRNIKFKTIKKKVGEYPYKTAEEARSLAFQELSKMKELRLDYNVKIPTFEDLFNECLANKTTKNKKEHLGEETKKGYRSQILTKFKDLLNEPLPNVMKILTPAEILERHRRVIEEAGSSAALNTFNRLRAIFNYATGAYPSIVTFNPVCALTNAGAWTKSPARQTMLKSSEEFRIFRVAIEALPPIHRGCFMFALYQGMRPSEACSLRWEDIDFNFHSFNQSWMTSETKHRAAQPLSRQTFAILEARLKDKLPNDKYVFMSDHHNSKHGHITLRADKLRSITGLDLTPHSLRRTFTMVGEHINDVSREHINRLTNHRAGTVTDVHYLVDLSLRKARKPHQLICDKLEALINQNASAEELFYESVDDFE